jgi:hypothetical protein
MADLSKLSDEELMAMYRQRQGSPTPAKPGAPPRVEERQTAYNTGRILASAQEMANAIRQDPTAVKPGMAEAVLGAFNKGEGLANLARSPQRQVVSQAQDDVIDALLYLATGAAYNKEQLEQQRSSYKVNYTDKPEAIAAKQRRLKNLVQAAKERSGSAWTPNLEAQFNAAFGGSMPTQAAQSALPANDPVRQSPGFTSYNAAMKQGRIDKAKPFGTRENPYVARSEEVANRLPKGSYVYLPNGKLGVIE